MNAPADDVLSAPRAIAAAVSAAAVSPEALLPSGSVRTYRCGDVLVRIDEDEQGDGLVVEHLVMATLHDATSPALCPEPQLLWRRRLGASNAHDFAAFSHVHTALAYPYVQGRVLDAAEAAATCFDIGVLLAQLHAARVMDLWGHLKRTQPLTLMESFLRAVDDAKTWLSCREADGLGHDRLTLLVADLQRALRPYCHAQNQAFLLGQRRVLCHGRPSPHLMVRSPQGLRLVGFDAAYLGDAANDLAMFAERAGLNEASEDELLRGYREASLAHGRSDARLVQRYFARRLLLAFATPMARLARMTVLRQGQRPLLREPVAVLKEEAELAYAELARAQQVLRSLSGQARALNATDVQKTGRLLAVEDLELRGRRVVVLLGGAPFSGRVEVGSAVARRLHLPFVPVFALARALLPALVKSEAAALSLLSTLNLEGPIVSQGLSMRVRSDAPYFSLLHDGVDVTDAFAGTPATAQAIDDVRAVFARPVLVAALRDKIDACAAGAVLVSDSHVALADAVAFELRADIDVRRQRALDASADVPADIASWLTSAHVELGPGTCVLDVGSRTANAAALDILRELVARVPIRSA